jgi:hypothetical protein
MTNDEHISEITGAFCEALQAAAQDLAEDFVKRVKSELEPSGTVHREFAPALRDGSVAIAGTRTQSETLEALLDAAAKVAPACGLMILRGAMATGWNCRGITAVNNFKRAIMDCSRGFAATVLTTGVAADAPVSELDAALVSRLGLYGKSRVGLVPLVMRERVAALLLALLPMGDELAPLQVLVQVAQLTLDLQLARKNAPAPVPVRTEPIREPVPQANLSEPEAHSSEHHSAAVHIAETHAEEISAPATEEEPVYEAPVAPQVIHEEPAAPEQIAEEHDAVPIAVEEVAPVAIEAAVPAPAAIYEPVPAPEAVPVVQSFEVAAPETAPEAEPVHAAAPPVHEFTLSRNAPAETIEVPAAPLPVTVPQPTPVEAYSFGAPKPAMAYAAPASFAPPVPVAPPTPIMPDPSHEKARRFAKLLVEEIKLYNQSKVAEGRARGDLYSRLREDIEKSRSAYQKRYGESVRDVDYFTQELVRILADNNRAVMGAGFPG